MNDPWITDQNVTKSRNLEGVDPSDWINVKNARAGKTVDTDDALREAATAAFLAWDDLQIAEAAAAENPGCKTVEVKEDLFEEADIAYRHAKVREISQIVIDGIDLGNGTCRISASIGSKHIKSVEVEDEHFAALADRIGSRDKHECFIPIAVKALISHLLRDPIDYEKIDCLP